MGQFMCIFNKKRVVVGGGRNQVHYLCKAMDSLYDPVTMFVLPRTRML